jgi:hypothetical protein
VDFCRIVVRGVLGVSAHCQLRSGEHSLTVILVHGGGYLREVIDVTLGIQTGQYDSAACG